MVNGDDVGDRILDLAECGKRPLGFLKSCHEFDSTVVYSRISWLIVCQSGRFVGQGGNRMSSSHGLMECELLDMHRGNTYASCTVNFTESDWGSARTCPVPHVQVAFASSRRQSGGLNAV